jgi:hypothetical protein
VRINDRAADREAHACRSRGRHAAMPKPVSRTCPSAQFATIWGGLQVLMDEAAPVELAQGDGDADRQA